MPPIYKMISILNTTLTTYRINVTTTRYTNCATITHPKSEICWRQTAGQRGLGAKRKDESR
jgi:hypothetical protein